MTYLPINSILGKLYSKEIITLKDKLRIKANPHKGDGWQHLLDHIIIPSVQTNVIIKFKRFVDALMESGDPELMSMAAKLGMQVT